MKKSPKVSVIIILALAVFLAVAYYISDLVKTSVKDRYYDEKIKAAVLMQHSMNEIKKEKVSKGIAIDSKVDINETGMIGVEYSSITTTLGSLEAKRTSTNPSFAAVIVDMLKELKLGKGDYIAVNFSGSFPALNIAVLAAAQVLEIKPVIISSAGASTYGANIPELNYFHMEQLLYDKGIIFTEPIANSLGGSSDVGKYMDEEAKEDLLIQLAEYNRNTISEDNLKENIEVRYELYQKESENRIKCFINVGGNLVSIGIGGDWQDVGSGIILPGSDKAIPSSGLIGRFLSEGVPVINMINIKELALEYGLPIDPYPIPQNGEDKVYYKYSYSPVIPVFMLVVAITALYFYRREERAYGHNK